MKIYVVVRVVNDIGSWEPYWRAFDSLEKAKASRDEIGLKDTEGFWYDLNASWINEYPTSQAFCRGGCEKCKTKMHYHCECDCNYGSFEVHELDVE